MLFNASCNKSMWWEGWLLAHFFFFHPLTTNVMWLMYLHFPSMGREKVYFNLSLPHLLIWQWQYQYVHKLAAECSFTFSLSCWLYFRNNSGSCKACMCRCNPCLPCVPGLSFLPGCLGCPWWTSYAHLLKGNYISEGESLSGVQRVEELIICHFCN